MNSQELYDLCAIREWAPLPVIDKIPARIVQHGIFPADLNLTCVAAVKEFLALGSDVGVVFWYNRHTGAVQKLKAEVLTRITCVSIADSVEYMVAAGHSSGQVSVFQIQKELPPDLDFVAPCMRARPVERYTVKDMHGRSNVSCCAWSKNAMKLYSGDRQGVVVLTEIDYQARLCKSVEILAESYEIVQLCVHQRHLLVSTLYRSIVCQRSIGGQWHITQVGRKDRKHLVDCGGTFLKRQTENKRPLLICARPGLRFWIADTEGQVEKTLFFREAIKSSVHSWAIPILNPKTTPPPVNRLSPFSPLLFGAPAPAPASSARDCSSNNFCALHLYAGHDSLVVTHDGANLYILNLEDLRVEAVARGFRKILDFCVCDNEIFVLEGKRSLLRLAPLPEKPNKTAVIIFNPLMPPPVPLLGAAAVGTFEAPVEYAPEEDAVISAEECFELPPIESLTLGNIPIELAVESPRAEQNRRLEIFQQISEVDFDQSILHHSCSSSTNGGRKQKKNRAGEAATKSEGIVEIAQAANGDAGDVAHEKAGAKPKQAGGSSSDNAKPEQMQLAQAAATSGGGEDESKGAKSKRSSGNKAKQRKPQSSSAEPTRMDASFCTSAYTQHMPDALSPDTLQRAIVAKAKTLAEELQLPPVHLAAITDEELHKAQAASALPTSTPAPPPPPQVPTSPPRVPTPPTTATTTSATSAALQQLAQAYPLGRRARVDDYSMIEPPRNQFYFSGPRENNYGHPVDMLSTWPAMPSFGPMPGLEPLPGVDLPDDSELELPTPPTIPAAVAPAASNVPNQMARSETENTSFLLDFQRAGDPLLPPLPQPAPNDSNTSSDWEFLDN